MVCTIETALSAPAVAARPRYCALQTATYNLRIMHAARPQSLRRLLLTHEFAFLVLVAIMGGLAGIWAYFWQQSSEESIRLNYLAHTSYDIRSSLFRQIQEVSLSGLREDPEVGALFSKYSRSIQESFNELRRKSDNRAEGYAVQNMQAAFSLLQQNLKTTLKDPFALNRLVRSKLLDPEFEQRFVADFEQAFDAFVGLIDQELSAQEAILDRWLNIAPYILPLPIVIGVALLVFSRSSLNRGFVAPMHAIVSGTRAMSEGNLEQIIPEDGVEEVAQLARGFNQMARELNRSRDALLDKERQSALGALVPVVAHNIRNPLAAIRANAQLIEGTDDPGELIETKGAIIETVDRLGRWVNALVSYLHPLQPERQPHLATALFDHAVTLLQPRVEESGVVLLRSAWDAEARIEADADLLEQALYGLVNNAIEASASGSTVDLTVARRGGAVYLSIRDEAGGIPFQPEPDRAYARSDDETFRHWPRNSDCIQGLQHSWFQARV